jgi:hypothetical protein
VLTLTQYLEFEKTATDDANSSTLEWISGDIRYYVLRNELPVPVDPNKKEIQGGEVFIGFTKLESDGKYLVNPVMYKSRCVQVMRPDQDVADAAFLEGDYVGMHSIRLFGYYMDAGQVITSTEGIKLRIIAFGLIGGLLNDTWLNDVAPAALEVIGEDRVIVTSIGPWLRSHGTRTAV